MKASQILLPRFFTHLVFLFALACALPAAGQGTFYAIGNRVWFDTDNSSTINGAEVGIDGVTVNLYAASDLTTVLATQTTANGGYYLFNGLQSGDYVVAIPSVEFTTGNTLVGYWSSATTRAANGAISETTAALANSDIDSDDNGTLRTSGLLAGAVASSVITLGPGATEPTGETDLDATLPGNRQGQPDTQANMTVDFGFYTTTLGNLVWNDLDNSGLLDGAEVGIDGVNVELWSGDGSTEINVGPDGVLGTTGDAPGGMLTSGGGLYTFSGLPAGNYIVRLPAVNFNFNPGGVLRDYRSSTGPLPTLAYEPAPDPNTNRTDSDDNGSEANGPLGLGRYIQSLAITLTPAGQQSVNNAQGATIENRLDFGVNNLPQLDLTASVTNGQSSYTPGATLNYDVIVTNHGPADANGMSVTAARPAQIVSWTWTCAGGTPAGYNCTDNASNPATFTDTLDLPQLASVTYRVTAQVATNASGNLITTVVAIPPPGMTDLTPQDNIATDTDTLVVTIPLAIPALNVWGLSILGLLLAATALGLRRWGV